MNQPTLAPLHAWLTEPLDKQVIHSIDRLGGLATELLGLTVWLIAMGMRLKELTGIDAVVFVDGVAMRKHSLARTLVERHGITLSLEGKMARNQSAAN